MAVDVVKSKREKEDPLERALKFASLGIGVAGLAQKGSGAADSEAAEPPKSEMDDSVFSQGDYELGDADTYGPKQIAMKDSIFSQQAPMQETAFNRRMRSLRLGVKY